MQVLLLQYRSSSVSISVSNPKGRPTQHQSYPKSIFQSEGYLEFFFRPIPWVYFHLDSNIFHLSAKVELFPIYVFKILGVFSKCISYGCIVFIPFFFNPLVVCKGFFLKNIHCVLNLELMLTRRVFIHQSNSQE